MTEGDEPREHEGQPQLDEESSLLEEQEGKGYGADPGERKRALDDETENP